MNTDIETVKKSAIYSGLTQAAMDALWDTKRACEEASKENFKNFAKYVDAARRALGRAEAYIKERAASSTTEVPK